jgi:hypothetical protein
LPGPLTATEFACSPLTGVIGLLSHKQFTIYNVVSPA